MKHKNLVVSFLFTLGLGGLLAQESPTASGGEASGTGGTATYSVGQVVYTTNTDGSTIINQGVQQPYIISATTGASTTSINVEMTIYPIPANKQITLKIDDTELSKMNYRLYDMQGKQLKSMQLENKSTIINMDNLPVATYLLKVSKNNKLVKTFQIIKTN